MANVNLTTTLNPNTSNGSAATDTAKCAKDIILANPSNNLYFIASVILGCVIMFENLLVVISVIKNKTLRKSPYFYMASLAVADFMAGLQIAIAFRKPNASASSLNLEISQGVFLISVGVSVFTLLLISINRYHVIVHPFHYRTKMNNTIVAVAIAASWVYAAIVGFLPVMGWDTRHGDCSPIYPGLVRAYVFFASTHVLLVLVVILVLYVLIFWKVRQSAMKFKKNAKSSEDRTHWKVAKTLSIVSAAFAICYIPLMVMGVMDIAHESKYTKFMPFFTLLAVINSGLNPIIYACREPEMRKTFESILCPCSCWQRRRAHSKSSNAQPTPPTCTTSCLSTRVRASGVYKKRNVSEGVLQEEGEGSGREANKSSASNDSKKTEKEVLENDAVNEKQMSQDKDDIENIEILNQ